MKFQSRTTSRAAAAAICLLTSTTTTTIITIIMSTTQIRSCHGFSVPMFQEHLLTQNSVPSKTEGVEIDLPDFDELFGRIQQVSPLARMAINGGYGGFENVDDQSPADLKWRKIESNKRRIIHSIDKIDNFQGLGCPIVRFRSSLKGPCSGKKFAEFIMDLDEREKWDAQIADVDNIYPVFDTAAANLAQGVGRYGDCSLLGVGYCRTKPNIVSDGREQLTLCGTQDFPDGSTIIWGTELEDWNNHLLPPGKRITRAKSHLFCTTLVPTGPDSFDVEYVLQLEIGGNIPCFLTTPVLVDTVKSLFKYAKGVFQDEDVMAPYIEKKDPDFIIAEHQSLLMTP